MKTVNEIALSELHAREEDFDPCDNIQVFVGVMCAFQGVLLIAGTLISLYGFFHLVKDIIATYQAHQLF